MNKYILGIKGMRCGMCEMHVEDQIRNNVLTKKVKASYIKNNLIVITEENLNEEDFHVMLENSGYEIISMTKEEAKKTLFGWK